MPRISSQLVRSGSGVGSGSGVAVGSGGTTAGGVVDAAAWTAAVSSRSPEATAARITIAEAGEIVSVGELEPESIVTPHLYVDYLVARP